MEVRFDRVAMRASATAEGYVQDTPVLTRVGVFPYRRADGTTRYELRPPEEVFNADTLASLKGKPITDGHPGMVNAANAKLHSVGAVLSEGRQDGDNTVGDIIIHDVSPIAAGKKELSCGYSLSLDETSGEWNGQRYDAVQRNIRYNHLALVREGRAGNARLNLDAADAALQTDEESSMTMVKVRLDTGISYDAAPEVASEVDALRKQIKESAERADAVQAQADSEKARADKAENAIEQARSDAKEAALARIALEGKAKELGASFKQDATDSELRIAVIKAVRGDSFDLAGKSDAYIDAAYDLVAAEKSARADAVAHQRRQVQGEARQDEGNPQHLSAKQAREQMIRKQQGET